MAKKVGYVLGEIGWEYNDEFSYRPESGGSNACAVYLDKQKADDEAERLNINHIHGENLACYSGDGLHGILRWKANDEEQFLEWANKELGMKWSKDDGEYEVPANLPNAKCKELLNRITIRFWEVLEVEIR